MKLKFRNGYLLVVILVISISHSVWADFRVWTDIKGKTIEARHICTMDNNVILKVRDGSEIKIQLDNLVDHDRLYAILQAPPRIEIKASPIIDRKNRVLGADLRSAVQVQHESVVVEVGIRKKSAAPYKESLTAEVILMGRTEEQNHHAILRRTKSEFQFSADNNNEHAFLSDTVRLKQVELGIESGVEYEGYLVAVTDSTGRLLELKCSKLDFEIPILYA